MEETIPSFSRQMAVVENSDTGRVFSHPSGFAPRNNAHYSFHDRVDQLSLPSSLQDDVQPVHPEGLGFFAWESVE
jgi:hypothetical protein